MANDSINSNLGRRPPKSAEVPMAAAITEYSWTAPPGGVRDVLFLLRDPTVAWRFSATTGEVAASGGSPVPAGASVGYRHGLFIGTLYFASPFAVQVMRIEYQDA